MPVIKLASVTTLAFISVFSALNKVALMDASAAAALVASANSRELLIFHNCDMALLIFESTRVDVMPYVDKLTFNALSPLILLILSIARFVVSKDIFSINAVCNA